ncbi:Microtubule-nucleating Tub4p (gamma-tubulin) complex component, partial [Elasticomyces elasticus]
TDFTTQLHELLKLMLAYRDAVDSLYSYSVAEFTRRQDLNARIETRTAAGKWGLSDRDDDDVDNHITSPSPLPLPTTSTNPHSNPTSTTPHDDSTLLPALRARLESLAAEFKRRVNVLLGDLAHQPDVDMRFLAVVMNFNDVYAPVRRRRGGDRGRGKEREGEVVVGGAERGRREGVV